MLFMLSSSCGAIVDDVRGRKRREVGEEDDASEPGLPFHSPCFDAKKVEKHAEERIRVEVDNRTS